MGWSFWPGWSPSRRVPERRSGSGRQPSRCGLSSAMPAFRSIAVCTSQRLPRPRKPWAGGVKLSPDAAIAYAARGRGERRRPSNGWASLTPSELEVVRLVGQHLTNPEIAARLFVSRATIKTHLLHVFAKLGVASRSELASEAIKAGILGRQDVRR